MGMKTRCFLWMMFIFLAAILACAPKEDRRDLKRWPMESATESGWARLALDSNASRYFPSIWVGDQEGNPIPYLVEKEGLWKPRTLEMANILKGRNTKGQPTVEFVLKFPEGWQVREREHLRVRLDLEGMAPWVCGVKVERRLEGSHYIALERESALHVFDLGNALSCDAFSVPWDAKIYRLTLIPAQGAAPIIKGLSVTAQTEPETVDVDEWASPRDLVLLTPKHAQAPNGEIWQASLSTSERIVGLDIFLKAPVAPIHPQVRVPEKMAKAHKSTADIWDFRASQAMGAIWNLPALNSVSTRVGIPPTLTDRLEIALPKGARMESVKFLIKREVLLLPLEAKKKYFLHAGGLIKRAPGDLATLPDSSRTLYARKALSLGVAEADPQGTPKPVDAAATLAELSRPWLPWIVGALAMAMALAAWRLLKNSHN